MTRFALLTLVLLAAAATPSQASCRPAARGAVVRAVAAPVRLVRDRPRLLPGLLVRWRFGM